jgi:hypothetical protein
MFDGYNVCNFIRNQIFNFLNSTILFIYKPINLYKAYSILVLIWILLEKVLIIYLLIKDII